MSMPIRVGIIGGSPDTGWAAHAHIPALRALPEYELRAVSVTRAESAARARDELGVPVVVTDHRELVARDDIDLVVVSVKVPLHRDLVMSALDARRMVLCEWPLGRDEGEAEELATAARARGVRTLVGTQGRFSPAVRHLRTLVRDGFFGRVLGTSMVGSGGAWGAPVPDRNRYLLDPANGATVLSIPAGHALDALCFALGDLVSVSATVARVRQVTYSLDGLPLEMQTPDQVGVTGLIDNGAVATVHFRGGVSPWHDFHWEVNGTDGDAVITGEHGHMQIGELVMATARAGGRLQPAVIPDGGGFAPTMSLPPSAVNVAALYQQLASDIRLGTSEVPDFEAALRLHRLLGAIDSAARTGDRHELPLR